MVLKNSSIYFFFFVTVFFLVTFFFFWTGLVFLETIVVTFLLVLFFLEWSNSFLAWFDPSNKDFENAVVGFVNLVLPKFSILVEIYPIE